MTQKSVNTGLAGGAEGRHETGRPQTTRPRGHSERSEESRRLTIVRLKPVNTGLAGGTEGRHETGRPQTARLTGHSECQRRISVRDDSDTKVGKYQSGGGDRSKTCRLLIAIYCYGYQRTRNKKPFVLFIIAISLTLPAHFQREPLTKSNYPRIMMKLIILSTSLRRCMKYTAGAIKRQADR